MPECQTHNIRQYNTACNLVPEIAAVMFRTAAYMAKQYAVLCIENNAEAQTLYKVVWLVLHRTQILHTGISGCQ